MAEAVLRVLMQNLNTLIQQEYGLIWGVHEDMEKLSYTLSTIRDVLEDAETKQIADKPIRNWLNKIKGAAYDADDILDEWYIKAQHSERDVTNKSITRKVSEFLSSSLSFKQIMFRHNIGKKLRKIICAFDEIAATKTKFMLCQSIVPNRVPINETSSTLIDEVVYGRDADKENIIHILLNNVNHEKVYSVLPIQGVGGLGKTTLAQWVFHDERIVNHFHARIWVCVSDDFDVKKLTKMIIEEVSGQVCHFQDLNRLQDRLREELSGKKFLLVLDDVWNDDSDKWEKLKGSLNCGTKGSSVIVTTRLETVTSVMGTLPPISLTFLSEEDCWSLFKGRAFGAGNEETSELVEIGKEIVKKCGGVPLAAKTLGGLMCLKREVIEWLHVRDSPMWQLPQDKEGGILPVLRLSYYHLPYFMRQCFSFCSIFPKDYKISKEELIHLWMANGFLQPVGRMELEDFGDFIFLELSRRSFFQEFVKDFYGNVKTCKMHDLMHDLACFVSVNECFIVEVGKSQSVPKGVRHLSLVFDKYDMVDLSNIQCLIDSSPVIRTLLFLGDRYCDLSAVSFKNLGWLRALDVSGIRTEMLPGTIGKLKHLRYLNLSYSYVQSLPRSFSKLINLQSFKIRGCRRLKTLPNYMTKFKSLRHLDNMGGNLSRMPNGMGNLTQLKTLSSFVVGQGSGSQMKELQGLNHLRGSLAVMGLDHVRNAVEAKEANLASKRSIFSLHLYWGLADNIDNVLQEKVMEEGLRPRPSLKVLSINNYRGRVLPTWLALLPNLVEISLTYCYTCQSIPPLGQLPLLRVLRLTAVFSVKSLGDEFYGTRTDLQVFPSLEQLEILGMFCLEEWSSPSSSVESPRIAFPVLTKLRISSCPKLKTFPFTPYLHHLHVEGCNEAILRSVGNLSSCLSSLNITGFPKLTPFPQGMLMNFTSLRSLSITSCSLTSLPGEIQNLTALKSLHLSCLFELECLPEELQKLTSLENLHIRACKNLNSLSVIETQGLKNLRSLKIRDCHPDVHKKYEKEKGENWQTISHIPNLEIQSPRLSSSSSEDKESSSEDGL